MMRAMHPRLLLLIVPALASLTACGGDDDSGACDPTRQACTFERRISETTVAPGQEIDQLCQSWTLDNPTELWVSNVRMDNGGVYHHSNWYNAPDNLYEEPDGAWPCEDAAFDELTAAVNGGYLFAQSTQVDEEAQVFPPGVAVRIPPWSKIVGMTHLLNAGTAPVDTYMSLSFDTIPPDDVTVKLTPARMQYDDLTIEPMAQSEFTADCSLADVHQDAIGAPLSYKLFYALPHYHSLGIHAQLEVSGGPNDGQVLFETNGYGEAAGVAFSPPLDLVALEGTGLRFSCTFDNPRSEEVGWGIGDQEMCVIALFAETPMAFQGGVPQGGVTTTDPDGVIGHAGDCQVFGFEWDHDKAGGPPR